MDKNRFGFLKLLVLVAFVWACNPTLDNPLPDRPAPLGKGIYILNYGLASGDGAGLDFYSTDSTRIRRNIFVSRNGIEPGKGLLDIGLWKQYAFFTAEKSSAVWVMNASNAVIAGRYNRLTDPRRILIIDAEKTYLSSATQKGVHVMHTATLQYTGTIALPAKVEHLALASSRVFAAPQSLQTANSAKIYVIDNVFDVLIDSIQVPGPITWMAHAPNGTLWVLCHDNQTSQGILLAINTQNLQVQQQYPLPMPTQQFSDIAFMPHNKIAILAGDVFQLDTDNPTAVPQVLFPASGRVFTSLLYDASETIFYLTGYRTGSTNGHLFRFGSSGILIDSVETGIMPVATSFN